MTFRAHLDRKSLIAAGLFVMFVLVLEALFFSTYRDYLVKAYGFSDIRFQSLKYYALFLFGYFFPAFLLFVFVYLSIVSARLFKALYFAAFSLTALFEFTYQDLFGRFSTIQDLGLALITTSTQKFNGILNVKIAVDQRINFDQNR